MIQRFPVQLWFFFLDDIIPEVIILFWPTRQGSLSWYQSLGYNQGYDLRLAQVTTINLEWP